MKCPKCNQEKTEVQSFREWLDFYDGNYIFALDNIKLEEYVLQHENEKVCDDCFDRTVAEVTNHS